MFVSCTLQSAGAVNTITFIDNNRRFVSTSDDKSLRVWEWDIPVDFKYLADPSMHSMPFTVMSPNQVSVLGDSVFQKFTPISHVSENNYTLPRVIQREDYKNRKKG